jgi:hypothetical protein
MLDPVVEYAHDVGVVKTLGQACLAPEPLNILAFSGELLAQNLDGHDLVGIHIAAQVHSGKTPGADNIIHPVLAFDGLADHVFSL